MQFIHIAGNVGKDAATKDVNGNTVTEWSVAVSNGRDSASTWFKCSMWGNRGPKIASYIRKGDKITVAGRLTAGVYDGKPDLKIDVQEVTLQGGKSDAPANEQRQTTRGSAAPAPADDLDDDCPFIAIAMREPGSRRRI
jgi:single-strand DNA-binding protein